VSQLQRRYGMGVKSIYSAEELTLSMQQELQSLQPILDRNRTDTVRVMQEIEAEQSKVDETRRMMEMEQQTCERKALEAHRIKMDCEADLASAMPELDGVCVLHGTAQLACPLCLYASRLR
jgi:dynein heavy chain